MRKVTGYCIVEKGKVNITHKDIFMRNLLQLGDFRGVITIERQYRKRSTRTENGRGQNGYYWHIVLTCFQNGWLETHGSPITKALAHEKLKEYCNPAEWINESTGEIKTVGKSTADLTTVEFEEYCETCRNWIYEWFGILVPLPNTQTKLFEINNG